MKINIKGFDKLIPLFLVAIPRHVQSTQNNKFSISLQCLKEQGRDEVFFHADKQQIFLLGDTVSFGRQVSHTHSTQNNKLAKPLQCLKEVRDEVDFLCG